jgi:putative hydroxymethylpyrimidine transport system ATP-binding protein
MNQDILFNDVSFSWGDKPLCQRLNLQLRGGKTTVMLGRSGIGKSTLLRLE